MTRLLSANFVHLKKNRCFWTCIWFMVLYGAFMVYMNYWSMCRYGYDSTLDSMCRGYTNLMGFASALLVSLFLGTEYSDGVIRNKLVVGHQRHTVYLAGLTVNAVGVLMINAVYVGVVILLGAPFLGASWQADPLTLLKAAAVTVLMDLSYTAIFTMCSMLNQNKASVTAGAILGALILCLMSGYIQSRLNEPKIYEAYTEVTDKGYVITREAVENPYYLEGTKREAYTVLNDLLPSGQGMQLGSGDVSRAGQMSLYSGLILVLFTGTGIFFFCRKDIK